MNRHAGGFASAARQVFDSHRTLVLSFVLSFAGILTGMATAMALLQAVPYRDMALIGGGAVLAGGIAAWHSRHLPLAALAALAPLPGLIWAAPLSGGEAFGAVPFLAYGFGFAAAAVASEACLQRLLEGRGETPWRAAAEAVALMALLAMLWFWQSPSADAALQAVADSLLAAASVLLLLPLGASLLHFDEAFVARINRAREKRKRRLERLSLVLVPRWGLSFAGIVLVFLALGWFGAGTMLRGDLPAVLLRVLTVLLLVTAAGTALGGWREGLAAMLVAVTVFLVTQWLGVLDPRAPHAAVCSLETGTLALFLVLQGGRRALIRQRQGDTPASARQRSLEDAAGEVFAVAGALAALLPALVLRNGTAVFAAGLLLAMAGIAFAPAVVTALEALRARRRPVEELYGRRRF